MQCVHAPFASHWVFMALNKPTSGSGLQPGGWKLNCALYNEKSMALSLMLK